MATSASGGKITGLLALTMGTGASTNLAVGDFVHLDADYQVAKADGTKAILGHVSVANKTRGANGAYPANNPGGNVTVETAGFYVKTMKSQAAIAVGALVGVGVDATSPTRATPAGANVTNIGIALMAAGAADVDIDVLVRGF